MWQSAGLLSCVRVVARIYVKWLPHLLICYLTYLPDWQPFYYPYNRYHLKKRSKFIYRFSNIIIAIFA
nr:MAG TPA: hypothetical protein [Caudoviricetes sp.]